LYVDGQDKDEFIGRFVNEAMMSIRVAYHNEGKGGVPPAGKTLSKIKEIITLRIKQSSSSVK